ncbi:hypothetical protein HDE_10489 [Halotydeus destructor]|nr:hypothetical protein HDE_10489 [Halotydeus destructor]
MPLPLEQLSKVDILKVKLKKWEKTFHQINGRKPGKEDVKRAGEDVQELYRKYWECLKKHGKSSSKDHVTKEKLPASLNCPKIDQKNVWNEGLCKKNIPIPDKSSSRAVPETAACKPFLNKLMQHYSKESVVKKFRFKKKKKSETVAAMIATESTNPPTADELQLSLEESIAFHALNRFDNDKEDLDIELELPLGEPFARFSMVPSAEVCVNLEQLTVEEGAKGLSELQQVDTFDNVNAEEMHIEVIHDPQNIYDTFQNTEQSVEVEPSTAATVYDGGVSFEPIGPSDIYHFSSGETATPVNDTSLLLGQCQASVENENKEVASQNDTEEPEVPFETCPIRSERKKPKNAENFIKNNMKKKCFASKGYKKFNVQKYKRKQYNMKKYRK